MARLPQIGEDISDIYRGSGEIRSRSDYLKDVDPITYYYEQFKQEGNEFLRDNMWAEASRRGESALLINTLNKKKENKKLKEEASTTPTGTEVSTEIKTPTEDVDMFEKWKKYEKFADYDSYMLAVEYDTLDDTDASRSERIDQETGYNFGTYTDRGWAREILEANFNRYEAELVEERKANRNFFQKLGDTLVTLGVDTMFRMKAGVSRAAQDIYNIGQGIVRILCNYNGNGDISENFLSAFADDENELFQKIADAYSDLAYHWERDHTFLVNAVDAYEGGYRPAEDYNIVLHKSENVGASYTTWGKYWSSALDSIGYMLPSICLTMGLGATAGATGAISKTVLEKTGSAFFYTYVTAGNIKDTVGKAQQAGLSYKDLNAGEVVSNAIIKSAAQYAIEVMLGKLIGWSGLDRMIGIGGTEASEAITRIGKTEGRAFGLSMLRMAKSALKEGSEEFLQDTSDGLVDYFFSLSGSNLSEIYKASASEELNIRNLLDSFIVGALTEVVTSSVKNAQYFATNNRYFGSDENGKIYTLGAFQSMNLEEALTAMNEWNDTLNDPNASNQDKANAALRLSITTNTVGSVLRSMGTERTLQANALLNGYLNDKLKKKEAITQMSNTKYATELYNTFTKEYNKLAEKYVPTSLGSKIKSAITKLGDKLKKSGVTKLKGIITTKMDANDPDINYTSGSVDMLQKLGKAIGVQVFMTHDGKFIGRSEDIDKDIMLIPNDVAEKGDIETILRQDSLNKVVAEVEKSLSPTQKKMILLQYQIITKNSNATMEEAVKALMFDKDFYTKILLYSGEKKYQQDAINTLAVIDKVAQQTASTAVKEGTLEQGVLNTMMTKIKSNMKAGILNYATKYATIDLDSISEDIIDANTKKQIKENKNVLYTKLMNDVIVFSNEKRGETFVKVLNQYSEYIDKDTYNAMKEAVFSNDPNKVDDAKQALNYIIMTTPFIPVEKKLIYLPTEYTGKNLQSISDTADYFGVRWTDLINGDYDATDLSPEAKEQIEKQGYNMNDFKSRMAAVRNVLFTVSNGTLTIENDGQLVQVIQAQDIVRDNYLTENGNKQFVTDIKNKKITSTKDIFKDTNIKYPDIPVVYKENLDSKGKYDIVNGRYTILIGPKGDINSFCHELTHATQQIVFGIAPKSEFVAGAEGSQFEKLLPDAKRKLVTWLKEKRPILYAAMKKGKENQSVISYYNVHGEIEANSTFATFAFTQGFTWKNNRSILVANDGTEFDMTTKKSKDIKENINNFNKNNKTDVERQLDNDPKAKKQIIDKGNETLNYAKNLNKKNISSKNSADALYLNKEKENRALQEFAKTHPEVWANMACKKVMTRGGMYSNLYYSVKREGLFYSDEVSVGNYFANPYASQVINTISKQETYTVDFNGNFWTRYIPSQKFLSDIGVSSVNELFEKYGDIIRANSKSGEGEMSFEYKKISCVLSTDDVNAIIFTVRPDILQIEHKNVQESGGLPIGNNYIVHPRALNKLVNVGVSDAGAFVKILNKYFYDVAIMGSGTQFQHFIEVFNNAVDTNDYSALTLWNTKLSDKDIADISNMMQRGLATTAQYLNEVHDKGFIISNFITNVINGKLRSQKDLKQYKNIREYAKKFMPDLDTAITLAFYLKEDNDEKISKTGKSSPYMDDRLQYDIINSFASDEYDFKDYERLYDIFMETDEVVLKQLLSTDAKLVNIKSDVSSKEVAIADDIINGNFTAAQEKLHDKTPWGDAYVTSSESKFKTDTEYKPKPKYEQKEKITFEQWLKDKYSYTLQDYKELDNEDRLKLMNEYKKYMPRTTVLPYKEPKTEVNPMKNRSKAEHKGTWAITGNVKNEFVPSEEAKSEQQRYSTNKITPAYIQSRQLLTFDDWLKAARDMTFEDFNKADTVTKGNIYSAYKKYYAERDSVAQQLGIKAQDVKIPKYDPKHPWGEAYVSSDESKFKTDTEYKPKPKYESRDLTFDQWLKKEKNMTVDQVVKMDYDERVKLYNDYRAYIPLKLAYKAPSPEYNTMKNRSKMEKKGTWAITGDIREQYYPSEEAFEAQKEAKQYARRHPDKGATPEYILSRQVISFDEWLSKEYNMTGDQFDKADTNTKAGIYTRYKRYLNERGVTGSASEILHQRRKIGRAENKPIGNRAYVNTNMAKNNNKLNHFVGKYVDNGIIRFIRNTSNPEIFDKLDKRIQNKIDGTSAGTLTYQYMQNFIRAAKTMNNETFKHIAADVFNNDALSELDFETIQDLIESTDIQDLAALYFFYENNEEKLDKSMTLEQLKKEYNKVESEASKDSKIFEKWKKAKNSATQYWVQTENGQNYPVDDIDFVRARNSILPAFFYHYDGTIRGIKDINAIWKTAAYDIMHENPNYTSRYTVESKAQKDIAARKVTADKLSITNNTDIDDMLTNKTKKEKLTEIFDFYDTKFWNKYEKLYMPKSEVANGIEGEMNVLTKKEEQERDQFVKDYKEFKQKLARASESAINKKYLEVQQRIIQNQKKVNAEIEAEIEQYVKAQDIDLDAQKSRTLKNAIKDIKGVANKVIKSLKALSKNYYNRLSQDIKQYIIAGDYDTNRQERIYTFNEDKLDGLSIKEVDAIKEKLAEVADDLRQTKSSLSKREAELKKEKADIQKQLDKLSRRELKATENTKIPLKPVEKIVYTYKTILNEMKVYTTVDSNNTVKQIMNTQYNDQKMSQVQGITNNIEQDVISGETFFDQNSITDDIQEVSQAAEWFIYAKLDATDENYRKFEAAKMFFLGYILQQSKEGGIYESIDTKLKEKIETALRNQASAAGTTLATWNYIINKINPLERMASQQMIMGGVEVDKNLRREYYEAIKSNDYDEIVKVQNKIMNYVNEKKNNKKSIYRKIATTRAMSMLSSPLTWLRNKISNMIVKPLNKFASNIGNSIFKGKHQSGQLTMTKTVSKETQAFIMKHFVDNGFFDKFVKNISKYNPSDINEKSLNSTGIQSKEAILAKLVIKSMYNEYYNDNQFKSPFMNKMYQFIMARLSDDAYIREAALRYFGKIIEERGYDLSKDKVTDEIMNDFSKALGLALSDYMHNDNFFNDLEKAILTRGGELGWFAYKTVLPFAAASWNWFKAGIKLSPIGLVRSIYRLWKLDKTVTTANNNWLNGKTQIAPELAEYIAKRELGQGVIGTVLWGLGMLLAGLGFIRLEEKDYGMPKLRVGNLTVDVSSIFGSSSLLAGAALINGIKEENLVKGLNQFVDVTIDGLPLMEIVQMDMFSAGGFSMGVDQLESIALSFIPNIIAWIAGMTYTGKVRKDTLLQRAAAKIPFLSTIFNMPKQVDIYTGSTGGWWDLANRAIPYLSWEVASQNESKSTALGLNKTQLRGSYKINDEQFTLSAKDTQAINVQYGKWNAEDLTKFYNDQMSIKIQVGNSYQMLKYSNMTEKQRKSAVQTIMSNNAELAKIMAWTSKGHKYYTSQESVNKLRQKGIIANIFVGNRGFVK